MDHRVAEVLKIIREKASIKSREVAEMLHTTPETVSRWKRGKVKPRPDSLEKLLTLEMLVEGLAEFYEPYDARIWLFAPQRLLDGQRPMERIQSGGISDVLRIMSEWRQIRRRRS